MQTFASTANAKNSGVKYETLWISGTVHDLMQVAMKNECNYLKKNLCIQQELEQYFFRQITSLREDALRLFR